MEQIIRLILLAIGVIVVLWILYDGIKRQKQLKGKGHISEDTNDMDESVKDGSSQEADYIFEYAGENMPELNVTGEAIDNATREVIEKDASDEPSANKNNVADDIIMLMIVPKKGQAFSGSILLQTLFSHDLHYGEQQIFHRYAVDADNLDKPLFSVASASESGDFDLNSMRENSYRGLVVFMEPAKHLHPADVFDMMVEVAHDLAADLNGKLLSRDQQSWTKIIAEQIRATM